MEIEFLILADSAQAVGGKLYMLGGGWSQYRARAFPFRLVIGIALGLSVPWDETNQKRSIELSIVDEDGQVIMQPVTTQVELGRPPGLKPGSSQRVVIAATVGLRLQKAGRYEVVGKVEGQELKRVYFDAVQVGPAPAPPPPKPPEPPPS